MTAMSALCQIATWQFDRDRSSYRPRSDIHRRTYQTSCAPRDDLVSRLRGVELSGNSSMISRARARAGARKEAANRTQPAAVVPLCALVGGSPVTVHISLANGIGSYSVFIGVSCPRSNRLCI